ncbi:MAG: extracellular solute-binding protein [bacterium]|nr:extracellular solute-binding protein [bacterium]
MKATKLWAAALAGTMVVGSLAGCGDKSTSSDATATPAGTDAGKKKVALKVWGPQEDQAAVTGYKEGWLKGMCEKFNAAHPEWDITFTYGVCAEGDAYKTIKNDVATAADVYMFPNDQIPDLVKIGAIAQLGGQTVEDIKANNDEAITTSVTYQDAVYGVPFTSNTWFMYYDKTKYSEDEVKSLDTMMAKDLGNDVVNVGMTIDNSWYAPSFFYAGGCTLFGENGNDASAGCDFNNDKGVEVAKYMIDLTKNKKFMLNKDSSCIAKFKQKKLGAYFSGSWDYTAIKDALGEKNVGVAVLPTAKIGGTDGQIKSFAGSKAIGVNPNSKDTQVAVALAAYLGSQEAQETHYATRGIIPTNKTVLQSEAVQKDPVALVQQQVVNTTSVIQPVLSEMGNFWTPVESFAKEVVQGTVTADNAKSKLDSMVAGITKK